MNLAQSFVFLYERGVLCHTVKNEEKVISVLVYGCNGVQVFPYKKYPYGLIAWTGNNVFNHRHVVTSAQNI